MHIGDTFFSEREINCRSRCGKCWREFSGSECSSDQAQAIGSHLFGESSSRAMSRRLLKDIQVLASERVLDILVGHLDAGDTYPKCLALLCHPSPPFTWRGHLGKLS